MDIEKSTPTTYEDIDKKIQDAIEQALDPMLEYSEAKGIGAENRKAAITKMGEIANLVANSPDRVAHDNDHRNELGTSPTEYDIDRARFVANAIKQFADTLLTTKRKSQRERLQLAIDNVTRIAEETYNKNPFDVGSNTAAYIAEVYKYSKKSPLTLLDRLKIDKTDAKPPKSDK